MPTAANTGFTASAKTATPRKILLHTNNNQARNEWLLLGIMSLLA